MLYAGQCCITEAIKQYIHYVNCIYKFRNKLISDCDYVQVSKAAYYKEYIRKSIQTMYSICKSTFKLIKPVEIYKIHHYEIVLVSLSWYQIN